MKGSRLPAGRSEARKPIVCGFNRRTSDSQDKARAFFLHHTQSRRTCAPLQFSRTVFSSGQILRLDAAFSVLLLLLSWTSLLRETCSSPSTSPIKTADEVLQDRQSLRVPSHRLLFLRTAAFCAIKLRPVGLQRPRYSPSPSNPSPQTNSQQPTVMSTEANGASRCR